MSYSNLFNCPGQYQDNYIKYKWIIYNRTTKENILYGYLYNCPGRFEDN